jgi:hypothetical protein
MVGWYREFDRALVPRDVYVRPKTEAYGGRHSLTSSAWVAVELRDDGDVENATTIAYTSANYTLASWDNGGSTTKSLRYVSRLQLKES